MKYIETLREGERVGEIYLCKNRQSALTKAGKPYESLTLQDKTLIQAVQIGILLAWSYIESILDLRCLLSGGKIPLVKQTSEWKSDISLGEEVLVEKKEKTDSQDKGLSYREYLQLLLLLVGEEVLTYRAMDVIEQNIRLQQPRFRFDHQLYGMQMEGLYASKSLFLGLITVVNTKDGAYHFRESRSYSYLK